METTTMLVLARRIGQEIVISEDIHVVVLEVRGGQVRLGITAPPSVRVDRLEVLERRQREASQRLGKPQPAGMS
jgi:carbon storage regulator